jgi:hypothetical protein
VLVAMAINNSNLSYTGLSSDFGAAPKSWPLLQTQPSSELCGIVAECEDFDAGAVNPTINF